MQGVMVQVQTQTITIVLALLLLEEALTIEEFYLGNRVFLEDTCVDLLWTMTDNHKLLLGLLLSTSIYEIFIMVSSMSLRTMGKIGTTFFVCSSLKRRLSLA
jgi:hypothetical protein